jgi:hypothetical protein
MKGMAAVTLSNENGLSRSRPSAHLQSTPTPPYGPSTAASRAVLLTPSPALRRTSVLGLRAHRVDLTRRRNNRSPEREE